MLSNDLKIITIGEFGQLLYQINCLPYEEAQVLEQQLKQRYTECLDKWHELETLAAEIRERWPLKKSDVKVENSAAGTNNASCIPKQVEIKNEILVAEPQ